jgi:hypothetical protein
MIPSIRLLNIAWKSIADNIKTQSPDLSEEEVDKIVIDMFNVLYEYKSMSKNSN